MTDRMTREQRSRCMSKIRSKDTKPEMIVRRMAWHLGYRYKLHRKNLPGTPDLAFPARKKAIFVHGCFWHRHQGCSNAQLPIANEAYWTTKLAKNVFRDEMAQAQLSKMGWKVLIIWECEVNDGEQLRTKLLKFLE